MSPAGKRELQVLKTVGFPRVDLVEGPESPHVTNFMVNKDFLYKYWNVDGWSDLWGCNGDVVVKARKLSSATLKIALDLTREAVRKRQDAINEKIAENMRDAVNKRKGVINGDKSAKKKTASSRDCHVHMKQRVLATADELERMLKIRDKCTPIILLVDTPVWTHLCDILTAIHYRFVERMRAFRRLEQFENILWLSNYFPYLWGDFGDVLKHTKAELPKLTEDDMEIAVRAALDAIGEIHRLPSSRSRQNIAESIENTLHGLRILKEQVVNRDALQAANRQAREAANRQAREAANRQAREAANRQAREAANRQAREAANLNVQFHMQALQHARFQQTLCSNMVLPVAFQNTVFYETALNNALHHQVSCHEVDIMTDLELTRNVAFHVAVNGHAVFHENVCRNTIFHQAAFENSQFHNVACQRALHFQALCHEAQRDCETTEEDMARKISDLNMV
jgi:hypothetical protein